MSSDLLLFHVNLKEPKATSPSQCQHANVVHSAWSKMAMEFPDGLKHNSPPSYEWQAVLRQTFPTNV